MYRNIQIKRHQSAYPRQKIRKYENTKTQNTKVQKYKNKNIE
jgi:hypothetical protein